MQAHVLPVSITLAAAATGLGPAAPKVGSVTFEDLVRQADRIVVGRVEEVLSVRRGTEDRQEGRDGDGGWLEEWASVPIARLAVERTLLGTPTEAVCYLACGTWTCDISGAEVGERVLLFLDDTRWMAGERAPFHAALAETTDRAPVFQIADAGRGSMPLRDVEGRSYATLWTGDVILPEDVPTIDGPEPESKFIRSAPLDVLTDRVERIVARAFPRLSASLQPEELGARRFHVSVWADGRVWIDRSEGEHDEMGWRRCEPEDGLELLGPGRTIAREARLSTLRLDPYARDVREIAWLERGASWTLPGAMFDPEGPGDDDHGATEALLDAARRAWEDLKRESTLPLDEER